MGRRRTYKRRPQPKKGPPKNEEIKHKIVRVVDPEEGNLGDLPIAEALEKARAKGLDLVEIVSNTNPPITKIVDYGKHQYDTQKKERRKKAGSHESEVKGIRLGLSTSEHDINFKIKQITKFLNQNHRIKIEMKLRGREKAHKDLAKKRIQHFIDQIPEEVVIEQEPQKSHLGLITVIRKK